MSNPSGQSAGGSAAAVTLAVGTLDPPRATRQEWLGLMIMVVPLFMLATDMTVLYLAMPSIAAELRPVGAESLWILHIGEFLTAATMITFGLLTHRIGARRLLLGAVGVYGAASLIAAYAVNTGTLIGGRALLGVAAAAFTPAGLVLIRRTFQDPRQYGIAFATFMAAFAGGAAAGPAFGGLMLEHFWWGAVFLINVPIAAVLLVGGPLLLPKNHADRQARIDPVSVLLSIGAILALVYGLQETADGGPAALPLFAVAAGFALLLAFLRRQRTAAAPLLDLELFRSRQFSIMLLVLLVGAVGMGAADMLMTQHLQVVRGMGPLQTGLVLLAPAIAGTVGTMATPLLSRWGGPAFGGAATLAATGAAGFAVILLLPGASLLALVAALTTLALLGSPFFTLVSQLIIGASPEAKTGSATAVQEVASGLGNASSIAFLGAGALGIYRVMLGREAPDDLGDEELTAASESFGGGAAVVDQLGGDDGERLLAAVDTAFTTATQFGYGVFAVTSVGIAIAILWVRRHLGAG